MLKDELNIIEGCVSGDRNCQYKLYKHLSPKLLPIGIRYLKSKAEAEDCLQEVFIKIFNNLKNFNKNASVLSWATRIMINSALTRIRLNARNQNLTDISYAEYVFQPSESGEEYNELLSLMFKLPTHYRIVFNMYVIEGYAHKEIAESMGFNESTSRTYLLRAREMLRELHQKQNFVYNEK